MLYARLAHVQSHISLFMQHVGAQSQGGAASKLQTGIQEESGKKPTPSVHNLDTPAAECLVYAATLMDVNVFVCVFSFQLVYTEACRGSSKSRKRRRVYLWPVSIYIGSRLG